MHDGAKLVSRRADVFETLQSALLGLSSLQFLSTAAVLGADSVHVVFAGSQFYAAFVSERVALLKLGAEWALLLSAALVLVEAAIVVAMLLRKIISPSALQWLCVAAIAPAQVYALYSKHATCAFRFCAAFSARPFNARGEASEPSWQAGESNGELAGSCSNVLLVM